MPHENRKKYGPPPEGGHQSEESQRHPFSGGGFIRVSECKDCEGFHVSILDSAGGGMTCTLTFDSHEECILAAKAALSQMGMPNIHVGTPFAPPEPELLN